MSYDWGTQWPGVFERHADWCPSADGESCTCGPLGYIASITDPDTSGRVFSPMLETVDEARAWRREQELALDPWPAATGNGDGPGPRLRAPAGIRGRDPGPAPVARDPRLRAVRTGDSSRRAARDARDPREPRERRDGRGDRARAYEPPVRAVESHDLPLAELIERFLNAAEDGEARDRDGRPYSDEALAELEWALGGYVDGHLSDLDAGAVRGRHVFRLIEELEDAGMPRSRLESVVGALRELFDYATDMGLVRVNPATYVSLPANERRPRSRLRETVETRTPPAARDTAAFGENLISERTIWMCVKLVTLIFICIALVLVAESV